MSEALLRVDMDLNAPVPLTWEIQAKGAAINNPHLSTLWGFLWGFLGSELTETYWYERSEPPGLFKSVVCLEESALFA